ncbi:pentapeptide repeat-containing protein [Rhodococcus koreensis]
MPQQTPAEKFLGAVRLGNLCDFSDGQKICRDEMAGWGSDRVVPADLLKQVLCGEHPDIPNGSPVALRGAVITGLLDLTGESIPPTSLEWCRLDDVCFELATFIGGASFRGANFTGEASFDSVTFEDRAHFGDASFADTAWFKDVTFANTFPLETANSVVTAEFSDAGFAGEAWFEKAMFAGAANFERAAFATTAWFKEAVFTGRADFRGATFTGGSVTFTGPLWLRTPRVRAAEFTGALARTWDLKAAKFHTVDPGPWTGMEVILNSAVLHARSRVEITATTQVDARWLQAREGAHLVIDSPQVDLADAELLRSSILAGSAEATVVTQRAKPATPAEGDESQAVRARRKAVQMAAALEKDLDSQLRADKRSLRCGVQSLARINASELAISGATLDECSFLGAHGLDNLRISEDCSFQSPPKCSWDRPRSRPFTRRRVIAEEIHWRQRHDKGQGWDSLRAGSGVTLVSAPTVAGIYRELRKGMEDAKNEPGAADFYYGEMEMRRLSGRKTRKPTDKAASPAERALLHAYWAVSGYGLRASRALIVLALVLLSAALLFMHSSFAVVTDTNTAPQFHEALEFTARESISLLQGRAPPELHVQGLGTVLDFLVRLSGPVLLALFVLGVRGRIKR